MDHNPNDGLSDSFSEVGNSDLGTIGYSDTTEEDISEIILEGNQNKEEPTKLYVSREGLAVVYTNFDTNNNKKDELQAVINDNLS